MAKLIVENGDLVEEYELEDGSSIADSCEQSGVPFACTEGVCGTCVVEVKEGKENLTPKTQEESDFLGDEDTEERLACQCCLKKGTVKVSF